MQLGLLSLDFALRYSSLNFCVDLRCIQHIYTLYYKFAMSITVLHVRHFIDYRNGFAGSPFSSAEQK